MRCRESVRVALRGRDGGGSSPWESTLGRQSERPRQRRRARERVCTAHRTALATHGEDVLAILKQGLYCHVAVALDTHPAVIPTAYAVHDGQLYIHGSTANRIFRALKNGAEACVCVTLLDGLVLARSAFHHSVNYRSVVVYGAAREVTEVAEKLLAFDALIEHVVPGRSSEVRGASREEILRTLVLAIPLDEASAKTA